MKKRIGNDITFTWHIYRKDGDTQVPESFTGKEVEVKLISPLQRPVTIEDVTIATGVVTFTFRGKHQVTLGNYVAVLLENKGEDGMATLDVVDAVTLVPHSYMEEDGDEGDVIEAASVELDSEIGQGIDAYTKAETDNLFVKKIFDEPGVGTAYFSPTGMSTMAYDEHGLRYSSYNALGWSVYDGTDNLLTFGGTIYKGGIGTINSTRVIWEKTATQQIPVAMTSANGLMSAEDKGKLDALPTATELTQELGGKQDTINDLPAIRSGAQAGATAYQKPVTGIPATDLASAVQVSLGKADTALQEHQSLAALVNTGSYNTVSKKIELKHDNTVLAEIDATVFIKDGMVSSATINNGYLVITFNTDAGKEPISIALTDIFNPANYYTKSQVDSALSGKLDASGSNYGVSNGVIKINGLQDQDGIEYIRNGMHLLQGLKIYYYDYETTITGTDIVVHSKGELEDGSVSLRTLANNVAGKADKVSNATNGNFAALDSNGNLIDSGHKHSDYLTQHQDLTNYVQKSQTAGLLKNDGTVDTTQYLTQHQDISGKADKSEMSVVPGTGANADKTTITLKQGTSATVLTAHQDISGKENVMPITTATGATLSAVVGNYYRIDNVGTLAITLPTITGATKLQAITFLLICGQNAVVTFVPQGSETILYQEDFALEADTTYEVTALWNGSEWTLSRVIYE